MNVSTHFEIIIPFPIWRQALMSMLANHDVIATGSLIRDPGRDPVGLLVDDLATSAKPPTGADFPPLGDWLAVAAAHGDGRDTVEAWIGRLEPRFAQMLAILLVGMGDERGHWRGWTVERGVIYPLAGFRIVGPGMVHARVAQADEMLDADPERWARLRGALGAGVFGKVRASTAAVIGCSRTGNLVAGMLAALGVRALALVDADNIEAHNLDGMILATEAGLGENKAVALGRRLIEFRSDLLVKAVPRAMNSRAAQAALAGVDLIATCVDGSGDGARLRAAHHCRELLIPHLDIGTGVTVNAHGERQIAADVRLLLPLAGCIRCVGGLGDLDAAEYELHAPAGALPRHPHAPWNARGRLGSLVTINSIAAGIGVQSWLDLLEGSLPSSVWHRLRWQPGIGLEVNSGLVTAGGTL